jgi:hypothetical protein
MTIKNLRFILVACFLFPLLETDYLASAQAQTDVLRLNVFFERNHTGIDTSFRGNAENMRRFREVLQERLEEGCVVDAVLLRGSASPEGPSVDNKMLSVERSHALDKWFSDTLGLGGVLFHREAAPPAIGSGPCRIRACTIIRKALKTRMRRGLSISLPPGRSGRITEQTTVIGENLQGEFNFLCIR